MPKQPRKTDFDDLLKDIVRRLEALERIGQTQGSSVKEGALTVLDSSVRPQVVLGKNVHGYGLILMDDFGNPTMIVGKLPDDAQQLGDGNGPFGETGIMMLTPEGRISMRVDTGGWFNPRQVLVPSSNGFIHTHSSATYQEGWRFDFFTTGPRVVYDMSVWSDNGTVDFRSALYEYGTAPNYIEEVLAIPAAGQQIATDVLIPPESLIVGGSDNPVGRVMTLRFHSRMASGTGPVHLRINAEPYNAHD